MYVFMLLIYLCYLKGLVCIEQHKKQYFTVMQNVVLKYVVRVSCVSK